MFRNFPKMETSGVFSLRYPEISTIQILVHLPPKPYQERHRSNPATQIPHKNTPGFNGSNNFAIHSTSKPFAAHYRSYMQPVNSRSPSRPRLRVPHLAHDERAPVRTLCRHHPGRGRLPRPEGPTNTPPLRARGHGPLGRREFPVFPQ
ncbi:unnamed protein product, partial [Ectocarpus sp. 4 AP-2014]